VRFDVLSAFSIMLALSWVLVSCGESKFLRNVGVDLRNHKAQKSNIMPTSYISVPVSVSFLSYSPSYMSFAQYCDIYEVSLDTRQYLSLNNVTKHSTM
jgi:hypothetical protein